MPAVETATPSPCPKVAESEKMRLSAPKVPGVGTQRGGNPAHRRALAVRLISPRLALSRKSDSGPITRRWTDDSTIWARSAMRADHSPSRVRDSAHEAVVPPVLHDASGDALCFSSGPAQSPGEGPDSWVVCYHQPKLPVNGRLLWPARGC